jgi:GxxExxY protein
MNTHLDNQLSGAVIGAAIDVHRQLGPDLHEVAYEEALSQKLDRLGIRNKRQVSLPLTYKDVRLDCGYRIDILVEERLPLELKAVALTLGIHEAQLLTYLRTGCFPLGLLINFNVDVLKRGITRMVETREHIAIKDSSRELDMLKALDARSAEIVLASIEVHRHVGPRMLGSSYLACLSHEFSLRGLKFEKEVKIPLQFDGELVGANAEVPLVVEKEIPVIPLSVNSITEVHIATMLARLRQGGWKQGLLLNFNSQTMKAGLKRVVL